MNGKRYDEDFKKQIVKIYNLGNHSYRSLSKEYGISTASISHWVNRYNKSKSFDINDNRSQLEKENIKLKKQLKQAEMEIDILKQAALLLGKK